MKYEYIDKQPQVGDVVLWDRLHSVHDLTKGKPYLVVELGPHPETVIVINDSGEEHSWLGENDRHTIKTKTGSEGKPGDMMMRISDGVEAFPKGSVIKVMSTVSHKDWLHYATGSVYPDEVIILCTEHQQHITYPQPIPEEETMNTTLTLLIELMGGTIEVPKDALNSSYVGIMTSDSKYLGYVYADTLEDLEAIVALPENEGNTLHAFNYETSLIQKPRKVIKVGRS